MSVPADAREKALQAMIAAQPSATIAHGRMLAALEGIARGPGGGRPPRDALADAIESARMPSGGTLLASRVQVEALADALLADESLWAEQPSDDGTRRVCRGGSSADHPCVTCESCGATVTDQTPSGFYAEHDSRCGGVLNEPESVPSVPVVDRDALARAYDPDAFDDAVKKSSHPVAQVQWAARRKLATEAADRVFASGEVRDAADVWDEDAKAWNAYVVSLLSVDVPTLPVPVNPYRSAS